ncbi:MAG: leucine-rich repeat protein, partial [Kiritimatiellae bacterium]|nr:leucine-rich repeat protein [Kiritimatiellia bacterium]
MPVATAVLDGVSFDTTVATNDTVTLGRNELSIPLPYSSSMWNEIDPSGGVARITVYDESVFETEASEGVFNWTPLCAGFYRLSLTVGSVNYQKFVQFMAPTVCFAREGYSSCKLTASDGVSPIRYTTDGSDPTESSALYTGPFEISPSKWTTVKARTFGEGYLPGEICSEVFGKAGSVVSRAETTTAIDNTAGVRNIPCEAHALMYDVTWEGHESSRVAFSADGEMFVERTGAGEVEWMPTHEGLTTLSLKTLNESGTQEGEYTATFYVWPSEIVVTNGLLPLKEQLTGGIDALRSVVVSRDMTELCADFFDGCTGLKSVTLPLAILGDSVGMADLFPDSYTAITNVVLTGEGERIPPGAFAGCTSLENVEIPESVTDIGTGAFNGCAAMAADDGFLVIRGVLYGYFGDDNCVSIPDGVAAIDPKAFYGNTALAEVIIPSTVRRIGADAFAGCTSLTRVVIPSSVTEIGNNAFSGCNLIKDATLPGWKCGINFSNVTNLVIAEGTTNIANYAFQSCYSLESVTLPDSVTHIGYSAFSYCSNLKRVEIPDSVIAIGSYAFGSCNSELYDTASIPGIKLVDGWAIEVDKSKLPAELDLTDIRGIDGSAFRNCTSIERVTVPKNFISISDRMFYNCSSLKSVTIHDGIKNIGDSAFSGCSSLSDIIIPNSVTNIGEWAF